MLFNSRFLNRRHPSSLSALSITTMTRHGTATYVSAGHSDHRGDTRGPVTAIASAVLVAELWAQTGDALGVPLTPLVVTDLVTVPGAPDLRVVLAVITEPDTTSSSFVSIASQPPLYKVAVFFYMVRYDSCMKSFMSQSLDETRAIAMQWMIDISNIYNNHDEALVVGLSGHLGAGKTAFVKCVARELGIHDEITSPTFVLMKMYDVGNTIQVPWKRLIHIDAYRLERREDLEALRWEQLVADKGNLILIEWPEQVGLNEFEKSAHLKFEIKDGAYTIVVI